jgi:hypothetical protein
MPQFCSVFANFFYVIADLLPVLIDFFFAGSVADIASKLRSIFSQLLVIPAQLSTILVDFIAGIADIFEILSNLGPVMMPTVVMTNLTPIVMLVVSSVMIPSSPAIAVTLLAIALPVTVLVVFLEVRILLSILCVGSRRCSGDN